LAALFLLTAVSSTGLKIKSDRNLGFRPAALSLRQFFVFRTKSPEIPDQSPGDTYQERQRVMARWSLDNLFFRHGGKARCQFHPGNSGADKSDLSFEILCTNIFKSSSDLSDELFCLPKSTSGN